MDKRTISRLRRQFTRNAMLALIVVMGVLAGLIFAVNLTVTRNQIRDTMDYIADNNGDLQDVQILNLPETEAAGESSGTALGVPNGTFSETMQRDVYNMREFFRDFFGTDDAQDSDTVSLEDNYYLPYFVVVYDAEGTVTQVKANHMEGLTADEAVSLSDWALTNFLKLDQYGNYYYQVRSLDDGGQMVIFLNAESQVQSTSRLLYSSLLLTGLAAVVMLLFIWFFSMRAIAPLIRNADLQQQFITNASHELKTPLAVIKANTEMQEILTGENEWSASTLRQIDRMNALIQNLVAITRAQESGAPERMQMDLIPVIREVVDSYRPVAQQSGKLLESSLPDEARMQASDAEIRQLATLLLDNAVKYCDDGGSICVRLHQKGRETTFTVSNSFAEGKGVDYSRYFERFYRGDESHPIEGQSGFGIGLSIAENLVKSYRGSIRAEWKDGVISFVCVLK